MSEESSGVPIWRKYSLSIQEAAQFYGIGEKRLRQIAVDHSGADFILEIGSHVRIKRKQFEHFLDDTTVV